MPNAYGLKYFIWIKKTAQENGLLDNAKSNGETILTSMIHQTLGSDYTVNFK